MRKTHNHARPAMSLSSVLDPNKDVKGAQTKAGGANVEFFVMKDCGGSGAIGDSDTHIGFATRMWCYLAKESDARVKFGDRSGQQNCNCTVL